MHPQVCCKAWMKLHNVSCGRLSGIKKAGVVEEVGVRTLPYIVHSYIVYELVVHPADSSLHECTVHSVA